MKPIINERWARMLHWVGIYANLLLAIVTVFSAYGGMINPEITVIGAIAAMMFPGFLLLTLLVTLINLIWFRRQAIVNGVSILLCIGPILTICPLNFFRPSLKELEQSGENTIKVLTFNTFNFKIFSGNGSSFEDGSGNPTFNYILDQDADLVMLQEAETLYSVGAYGITGDQIERLKQQYPFRDVTPRGMALLSKFPFERVIVDVADPNQLDLVRFDVTINGQVVHLFNVHMQSIGLTPKDKEVYRNLTEGHTSDGVGEIRSSLLSKLAHAFRSRAAQSREVKDDLNRVNGPVLLCGDFNDIPGSYATRTIEGAGMTDAYTKAGLGPAITYHGNRFFFRIDHMFCRGGIVPLRVWRGDCPYSDHYPMLGYFKITQ